MSVQRLSPADGSEMLEDVSSVASVLADVRSIVDAFERGVLGPADVPVAVDRTDESDNLDNIEEHLFTDVTAALESDEDRVVTRRLHATFRMCRHVVGDDQAALLWVLENLADSLLAQHPNHPLTLRYDALMGMLDVAPHDTRH